MHTPIKFQKVLTLPSTLAANTLYLQLANNHLVLHLTDKDANLIYRTLRQDDIINDTTSVISIVDTLPEITADMKPGLYALGSDMSKPIWFDGNQYTDLFKLIGTSTGSGGEVVDNSVLRDAIEFGITLM